MRLQLPELKDMDVSGKRVLVRVDLDYKDQASGTKRQEAFLPTLDFLAGKASKIVLLGHRGRPEGKVDKSLSLKSAAERLEDFLKIKWGEKRMKGVDMYVMENLRFNSGEEANDDNFTEHLAEEGDRYINEAFATSHRNHASIVALPRLCKSKCKSKGGCVAAGFHFMKEVENLGRVLEKPKRPLVMIIGGIKKDKLNYIDGFKNFTDVTLIGGRLPEYLKKSNVPPGRTTGSENLSVRRRPSRARGKSQRSKVVIADLTRDSSDITEESVRSFEREIAKAGTVVLSGPMGKFEDEGARLGTEKVLKAVAASSAFKIAGGGDTERAISALGLSDKFDWISVGGGAMLEFLATGTLPGIKALLDDL